MVDVRCGCDIAQDITVVVVLHQNDHDIVKGHVGASIHERCIDRDQKFGVRGVVRGIHHAESLK